MTTDAQILNITAGSDDLRARELSNFQRRRFVLDGVTLASVEGFVQGIKYPPGHPDRAEVFTLANIKAKQKSPGKSPPCVWWNGEEIAYGSKEHHALIERAIRASFEQNPIALALLYSTKGMTLTHDLGHPESPHTCLPAKVFCEILTRLRDEGNDRVQIQLAEHLQLIPPTKLGDTMAVIVLRW